MRLLIFSFIIAVAMSVFGSIAVATETDEITTPWLYHEAFEDSSWDQGWKQGWAKKTSVAIIDGYVGSALQATISPGFHHGIDRRLPLKKVVGREPNQLWFRYMVRIDEGWLNESSGKLPGPAGVYSHTGAGGYPSTSSNPGWSARIMFGSARYVEDPSTTTRLGYYAYHLNQPNKYGEGLMFNDVGVLRHGEWYCLQGHIQLNTPGEHDGVLEAWIDGRSAFSRTDLAFRRAGEEHIAINWFWTDIYFGGKQTPTIEQSVTIDELFVSSYRVGCPMSNEARNLLIKRMIYKLKQIEGIF